MWKPPRSIGGNQKKLDFLFCPNFLEDIYRFVVPVFPLKEYLVIVNDFRCALLPENIDKLVFLACNLPD